MDLIENRINNIFSRFYKLLKTFIVVPLIHFCSSNHNNNDINDKYVFFYKHYSLDTNNAVFFSLLVQPMNQVCSTSSWSSSFTVMVGTGTQGTSTTQLSNPMGMFTDSNQNVYVADYSNNRIQKYVYGT